MGEGRPPPERMSNENRSTLDAISQKLSAEAPGHEAVLHLAFTRTLPIAGEHCALRRDGLLLGRGEPLFARTPLDDPRISRKHARIRREADAWVLEDLGSHNGTHLNGAPVTRPVPLTWGDVIRIGDTLLVLTRAMPGLDAVPSPDPELVGAGPAHAQVRQAIEQVAGHGHSVLILGETGTGKEVVARALHRRSGRPGEFVALNCGSVPESILDSELFGHARGAFTGAVAQREGLFRAAERGTLFLDELGEMPTALQIKLLRALETRRIRPLGASLEIPVDVRVIAATHRDVVTEVREGRFRADLYARLAQWFIPLPPLRERREDIGPLVQHMLARLGAAGRQLDVALSEALLLHDWPLNVRGLFNVLSMAALSAANGRLNLSAQVQQALEAERHIAAAGRPEPVPSESPSPPEQAPSAPPRRKPELAPTAQRLEQFLQEHRGNIVKVAQALGCSRQQVYRWIDELGLELERFRAGPQASS